MGKKVKNKDLAIRLGVSPTLVSLVLNNKADLYGIKKETQEKVLALARQMGFFDVKEEKRAPYPVETAPGIVGMIVPSLADQFVYDITPYLQKEFSSIGLGFTVILKDPDDGRFNRFVSAFRKFFSGLILVGEAADEKTISTLRDNDYPFVLLEKTTEKYRLNTVMTDVMAGINMLTEYIGRKGYRNILILCSEKRHREKEKIIKELVNSLNRIPGGISRPLIEFVNEPVAEEDFDFKQIGKYLQPPLSIQLIITINASLVYPLLSALENKKIRVPYDVALISFEEGPGFAFLHPPITSLRKPVSALAHKASNMIWSEIKNAGKSKYRRQLQLAPELVIRRSCGNF
ncbi:MAG TPA: LacI family DNA-binding transcriptional regulator [Bacteroidales bacterium]|nr:LacI family DNA-binding transcriptional regulator [Bacteroidales bacterium]HQK69936.1 LacI family DNA-binding transcriptional regulator [Bacteroidales bacterium]